MLFFFGAALSSDADSSSGAGALDSALSSSDGETGGGGGPGKGVSGSSRARVSDAPGGLASAAPHTCSITAMATAMLRGSLPPLCSKIASHVSATVARTTAAAAAVASSSETGGVSATAISALTRSSAAVSARKRRRATSEAAAGASAPALGATRGRKARRATSASYRPAAPTATLSSSPPLGACLLAIKAEAAACSSGRILSRSTGRMSVLLRPTLAHASTHSGTIDLASRVTNAGSSQPPTPHALKALAETLSYVSFGASADSLLDARSIRRAASAFDAAMSWSTRLPASRYASTQLLNVFSCSSEKSLIPSVFWKKARSSSSSGCTRLRAAASAGLGMVGRSSCASLSASPSGAPQKSRVSSVPISTATCARLSVSMRCPSTLAISDPSGARRSRHPIQLPFTSHTWNVHELTSTDASEMKQMRSTNGKTQNTVSAVSSANTALPIFLYSPMRSLGAECEALSSRHPRASTSACVNTMDADGPGMDVRSACLLLRLTNVATWLGSTPLSTHESMTM
mmetsp:Transcript_2180/g.5379  ORF Transcript_2180/g.5379 Transcript_2180/m.5379 type:complete len:519 (-) Transcript_2180:306-1862(-)